MILKNNDYNFTPGCDVVGHSTIALGQEPISGEPKIAENLIKVSEINDTMMDALRYICYRIGIDCDTQVKPAVPEEQNLKSISDNLMFSANELMRIIDRITSEF